MAETTQTRDAEVHAVALLLAMLLNRLDEIGADVEVYGVHTNRREEQDEHAWVTAITVDLTWHVDQEDGSWMISKVLGGPWDVSES